MYRGIDCATPVTARAAEILRGAGYRFVARYLVPPENYPKALTLPEAQRISDAGLDILCVWETSASRMRGGAAAGREDGERAFRCALNLGVPPDAIIYFAADYDAQAADMPAIREYLAAAQIAIRPYGVGVYGSYRVVEAVRGQVRGCWQCVAWSGGKISDAMTVYQAQWSGTSECQALAAQVGFPVDIDECPDLARAGMWSYRQQPVEETEEEYIVERYNTLAELPKWAEPTVKKLIERGYLKGNSSATDEGGYPADLDLSRDMVRMLVILDRAGHFA